jgi:hypothetical protein
MKNIKLLLPFLFLSITISWAQNLFPMPSGDAKLAGTNAIEFGQGVTKESNAGKIGYQKFSDAFDIVGAGTTGSNRKIKFWGEGGSIFTGHLDVGGQRNVNSAMAGLNVYDPDGQTYTNMQFAQRGWGGSHAILFNAFKSSTMVNGDLSAIGNTKYANDVGAFSSGAAMIHFGGNSGYMDFFISPNSSGQNTNINWEVPVLALRRGGNVGIGTANPDAKLAVKGTIHTNEVKVDLAVPGPDYVFNSDYKLLSLEEIKTYINKNKHLPEVPSAKEMEANGVQLGEMNMLLLKKVEELTLHMIEHNKAMNKLIKDNENQQTEIETLKARLK